MKALILWVFGVYMRIGIIVSSIFSDKPLYKGELRDKDFYSFSDRFCGIALWWPLALLLYFFEKRRKGGAA